MESIETQLDGARRFIAARGWSLDEAHIFTESGVSRAEFVKRPGLIALLNSAKEGAFDIVITRDESRIGGDTFRTGIVIQDIIDHGAKLFYYYTNEEVTFDDPTAKIIVAVRSYGAELERQKISERTHEHLLRKARRGLVVGGCVYGYDNVEVKDGDRRVRVEYRINEEQARVVRDIFRRYAGGEGLRSIAREFNVRGVPAPRAGRRGTGSWSPSSIRAMLKRERYIGVLSWGRTEKTYRCGTKIRVKRPTSELTIVNASELRIVDDNVWIRVQERERSRACQSGWTKRGAKPRYLLSGLARCTTCGGPIQVANAKVGYENVRVYGCAWHRDRGNAVCASALRRPVASIDAAMIDYIQAHVLREELMIEVFKSLRVRLKNNASGAESELPTLQADTRRVTREIERLTGAIAVSEADPTAIVRAIEERQQRLGVLLARIRSAAPAPDAKDGGFELLEQVARERPALFGELVQRHPGEGRAVVESLLRGPLTFTAIDTPEGRRFQIVGEIAENLSGSPSVRITA